MFVTYVSHVFLLTCMYCIYLHICTHACMQLYILHNDNCMQIAITVIEIISTDRFKLTHLLLLELQLWQLKRLIPGTQYICFCLKQVNGIYLIETTYQNDLLLQCSIKTEIITLLYNHNNNYTLKMIWQMEREACLNYTMQTSFK